MIPSQELFINDSVTCVSPWYDLRIDATGNVTYCQHADVGETTELPLVEWFNSGSLVQDVRKDIQQGHPVPGCHKCYQSEEPGIVSQRQRRNFQAAIYSGKYFKESVQQSLVSPRMCGKVDNIKPAFMHISLSNLCNLSCRTCFPKYSSNLTSTLKSIQLIPDNTPILLDWTQDPARWKQFCDLVVNNPSLVCLHFMGGEPLYHKQFYNLIDLCIEQNATDFHLTFVTNGSIFSADLVKKLKKFKSIAVEISLETFHPTNDYIRLGSEYQRIQHNIEQFLEHKSSTFDVVLRTVPQALSIMHYDTVIDFAIKHRMSLDSNVLIRPEFLKISVLPADLKKKIVTYLHHKYHNYIEHVDNHLTLSTFRNFTELDRQISSHIQMLITLLNESELSNIDNQRKQFVQYNRAFDQVSGINFVDLYPELKDFYDQYNTV